VNIDSVASSQLSVKVARSSNTQRGVDMSFPGHAQRRTAGVDGLVESAGIAGHHRRLATADDSQMAVADGRREQPGLEQLWVALPAEFTTSASPFVIRECLPAGPASAVIRTV
jgi:hypothetical protein